MKELLLKDEVEAVHYSRGLVSTLCISRLSNIMVGGLTTNRAFFYFMSYTLKT